MSRLNPILSQLFTPVSNNRLVVFRVLFGLVMAAECFGCVFTGRVNELFVATPFNFPFIGFEWLSFLHGPWMNGYYCAMGLLALLLAIGLYYRVASALLAVLWTLTYLAEKTHYNNHYYLMLLLCWLMALLPAHKRLSADVRLGRAPLAHTCFRWQHWLIIGQIGIVYVFAGIAKINPDWLQAMPLKLWMQHHARTPVIGPLFELAFMPWFMAYSGLLFDLFVVPALLWRRTRMVAFVLAVCFHLSNSILFGIGTFPYLAIALCIFFASPVWLERRLSQQDPAPHPLRPGGQRQQQWIVGIASFYLCLQLFLPIRHWLIPENVNWTEEGHRMAWRMMLRAKSGGIMFRIKDKRTGQEFMNYPEQLLTREQFHDLATHPDITWQYAQYLKKKYRGQGMDPAVYAEGCTSLNGKDCRPLIHPNADLAAVRWKLFAHNEWITGID